MFDLMNYEINDAELMAGRIAALHEAKAVNVGMWKAETREVLHTADEYFEWIMKPFKVLTPETEPTLTGVALLQAVYTPAEES